MGCDSEIKSDVADKQKSGVKDKRKKLFVYRILLENIIGARFKLSAIISLVYFAYVLMLFIFIFFYFYFYYSLFLLFFIFFFFFFFF